MPVPSKTKRNIDRTRRKEGLNRDAEFMNVERPQRDKTDRLKSDRLDLQDAEIFNRKARKAFPMLYK